jgi:hypothetical protein
MTMLSRAAVAGLVVLVTTAAFAQTPAQDTATAPALQLTTAQKQTIYQSVSRTQKNTAAPDGFRVSVGARVPEAIPLSPLPATLGELMPQTRGFEVAMIEKQVVLVDPKSKLVVLVVTHEEP